MEKLLKGWVTTVAITLCVVLAVQATAWSQEEHEEEVSIKEVKAGAGAVMKRLAKGGKILEIDLEKEGDRVYYDIEILKEGQVIEFKVALNGKILGFEIEKKEKKQNKEWRVALDDVKPAARETMKRLARGGKIGEIEAERKGKHLFYEIEIQKGGRVIDFVVASNGAILGFEIEKPEKKHWRVELDEVKPAARTAIKRLARGGKIAEIEAHRKGKSLVYEVEIKIRGEEIDFLLTPDGKVLAFEIEDEDDDEDEEEEEEEEDDDDDDDDDEDED